LISCIEHHALPFGWENMAYPDFLKQRRSLMAQTIRSAYERLAGSQKNAPLPNLTVAGLLAAGEGQAIEFKSTLRRNLHTSQHDPKIELAVLKTIAGFLNTQGGTLVIGVADDGTPVGVEPDGFPNEDKLALHLVSLLKERVGGQHASTVHLRFDEHDGSRVLLVDCTKSKTPAFVKDGSTERFYVRYGPSTQELTGATMQEFMKQRFNAG
jgi:predicted HTH transcriptional regulator